MNLKKFTAKDVREALILVKEELGPDAVILRTEKDRDGVIVTAALDDSKRAMPEPVLPDNSNGPIVDPAIYTRQAKRIQEPNENTSPNLSAQSLNAEARQSQKANESAIQSSEATVAQTQKMEAIMERAMSGLLDRMEMIQQEMVELKGQMSDEKLANLSKIPEEFRPIAGELINRGLSLELVYDVAAEAALTVAPAERTPDNVRVAVKKYIMRKFPVVPQVADDGRAQVHFFVGPTGVGKSTTIAKIAGRAALNGNMRVGIISTDSYRMGAIEQMNSFARTAEIEFEAVFDLDDIDTALERMTDKNLILVDSAGRSREHQEHLAELKKYSDRLLPDAVHLVLAAGTREKDADATFRAFADVGVNRLVFTKLDETMEKGAVYNLPVSKGIPVSWLANGQTIPDDLHISDSEKVVSLIFDNTL